MHSPLARLPGADSFRRRAPALAGFATGVATVLVLGMLATVVYTGRGYFVPPPQAEVIYPNL